MTAEDEKLARALSSRASTRNTGSPVADSDFETTGYYGAGDALLDRRAASAISRLSTELHELRAALSKSMVALDDWLNTYAPEFCDERRVQEALDRIGQYGTVAYIAHVQERNRAALTPSPGAEARQP